MPKPIKRSIAVVIRHGERLLILRRPDDDDELPGIWGLPAGSFRDSETLDKLIERIGRDKLGVTLTPLRKLTNGVQERVGYRLEMELWEVSMEGTPEKGEWQWADWNILEPGMKSGSLCCALALQSKSRVKS